MPSFSRGALRRRRVFGLVYFFIRYVAPAAIIVIFISNLLM